MINEVLEVKQILAGVPIPKQCLYRTCYMLAKWFHQQGKSQIQIRDEILIWANKFGYWINYDLNSIIFQALKDKKRLAENLSIYINDGDIEEIKHRFDRKNTRLLALAILCYAKAFANSNGQFSISMASVANWIKLNAGNVSSRFLPELVDFEYVSKIQDNRSFTWNKIIKTKTLSFIINVDLSNVGEYKIEDNDIIGLYNKVF